MCTVQVNDRKKKKIYRNPVYFLFLSIIEISDIAHNLGLWAKSSIATNFGLYFQQTQNKTLKQHPINVDMTYAGL